MKTNSHLPSYLGDDLEDDLLDAQLAYAIPKSDLETARSLFSSKWWDYRYVHPGRCYFLFADLYGKALEKWRTMFGVNAYANMRLVGHPIMRTEYERKGNVRTNPHKVLTQARHRTGLWRAMCFADLHGVPYDRYIDLFFQFAFENQWERMPMPMHLYGAKATIWVLERWQEEKADLLRLPTDPRFTADRYKADAYQKEFQDWLLTLIAKRPIPRLPLTQYLLHERYLVPRLAAARFGKETIREIVARARASTV